MSILSRKNALVFSAFRTASTSIRQRSVTAPTPIGSWLLQNHAQQHLQQHLQHQQQQQQQQQQRGMASNRRERLTVHQKKKTSRALVRARRVRNASIATVLGGEEWTGYEATMRQGLRELDDTTEVKRRGTHASKPLVYASAHADDEDENNHCLSERDAWAQRMEGVWNEVLQADSRGSKPRATLPGFPIHVVMVKIARDYGHHKIFWELSEVDTRPPDSTLRQLYQARKQGFSARAVVLKSTAERLRRCEGYLRANLAKRAPMRRVPEVRWQHISQMPMSLQVEL